MADDRGGSLTPGDRIAIGATLIAAGGGAAVQGWPLSGAIVCCGLVLLIIGVFGWLGGRQ